VKKLEVRVPHGLTPEEVRRRLDRAVEKARVEYAEQVGPIDASWRDDEQMEIGLTVMGMRIDSELQVLAEELVVRVGVPGMAALFAGRIRAGIEERLGGLLTT
jgi:hypothetical protein